MKIALFIILIFLLLVAIFDRIQKRHTLRRNFPVIGWIRYFGEILGPELRQYFVASNRDELPFNRSERSWIYAVSKGENPEKGFGSDKDFSHPNHFILKPDLIPGKTITDNKFNIKPLKVIGPNRRRPYYPNSVVNLSGISFGAISAEAVEAMNRGAFIAGCHQTTGEGGLSPYHLVSGANIILQFGTGYFGARTKDGKFNFEKLKKLVDENKNIVAIEFKISQGAKPLKQSLFPRGKMTDEIRLVRGLEPNEDAISPAYHSMFSNYDEMLDFLEKVSDVSGLPVGIKCAPGKEKPWHDLCQTMIKKNIFIDYLITDGGASGTGSSPESFSSYVGLPFQNGFAMIYKIFQQYNLTNKVVFVGSEKLGLPHRAVMAFTMGADLINVAREAMMSIGCLQTQHCSNGGSVINGGCPVGIATQNKWSRSGLDPIIKGVRLANYIIKLRKEIIEITNSMGYSHPNSISMDDIVVNSGDSKGLITLGDFYGYHKNSN